MNNTSVNWPVVGGCALALTVVTAGFFLALKHAGRANPSARERGRRRKSKRRA